jgi:hypothetical protein
MRRAAHSTDAVALPQAEIVRLSEENRQLHARIDRLELNLEQQRLLSASWAHRDLHYTTVRILVQGGGAIGLEDAENRNDGLPRLEQEQHLNLDDPRCHWIIVPVAERSLFDCGVRCVRLMKAPTASENWNSTNEYKWSGRKCIDHGGNPVHMWDAGGKGNPNQGWLMEHSGDGQVAFRASNKGTYLSIDGSRLVLDQAPLRFQLMIVPLPHQDRVGCPSSVPRPAALPAQDVLALQI